MQAETLYQEELYVMKPKVLVIISTPWEKLSEADQVLLSRILASVKLSIAHVQVINETTITPERLASYAPQRILIFGSTQQPFGLYQNFTIGAYPAIAADDLSALDDAKKKSLWLAMKQMFGL